MPLPPPEITATRADRRLFAREVGRVASSSSGRTKVWSLKGIEAYVSNNSPLMISLRTSVVPAPISSSFVARNSLLISDSQIYPVPP